MFDLYSYFNIVIKFNVKKILYQVNEIVRTKIIIGHFFAINKLF